MRFGKKSDLRGLAFVLSKEVHGPAPRRLLMSIEFAKIEHMALHDAVIGPPAVFHGTPEKMVFAVLRALFAAEEDGAMKPLLQKAAQGGEVGSTSPFGRTALVK